MIKFPYQKVFITLSLCLKTEKKRRKMRKIKGRRERKKNRRSKLTKIKCSDFKVLKQKEKRRKIYYTAFSNQSMKCCNLEKVLCKRKTPSNFGGK